ARSALRTQQTIAAEPGVTTAAAPVAGSYAIESLTNDIERGASALIERIVTMGGTLAAIESGLIQREIQDSAYRAQQAVDSGQSVVVGVNRYQDGGAGAPIEVFKVDPDVERGQIARVQAVRSGRGGAWKDAVAAV